MARSNSTHGFNAWTRCAGAAAFFLLLALAANTRGDLDRKAFRVCADPNNLPYSNERGEGYENKIAELFARRLNLPLEYYFSPQRLNFVRNTLRFKLPDSDFRCDILMGVPAGFDQVWPTKPYYRSTHVIAYVKGRGLDKVQTQEDFLALGNRLDNIRIGVFDRSPASMWLVHHNLVNSGLPFRMLSADPDWYPGQMVENELATDKIQAAIVWGPVAAYAASRVKDKEIVLVPLASELGAKLEFDMAMGIRRGETEWMTIVESLIDENRAAIETILREYRIPLVDGNGQVMR
jgi:quinoprotein dehydrogenase-associated probable ABC transporter substrate-binding protein